MGACAGEDGRAERGPFMDGVDVRLLPEIGAVCSGGGTEAAEDTKSSKGGT